MPDTGNTSQDTPGLRSSHAALASVVFLLCVMCYAVALHGPLIFDDIPNLLDNRLMQIDGREFDDWRVAVISNNSGLFHRPVAMATFTLNYVAAGEFSPVVFKGTNLAIHLLIAVLVYFLCRALLRSPAFARTGLADQPVVALVAAALWLLHPLHVSTVLYVVQRMAQLSSLFTVLGLLVFCRYRLRWAELGASTGELIAAALWLLLITGVATLSKENGALLPWLIAAVEVALFRGRWAGRSSVPLARLGWFVFLVPVLLVALVFLFAPELITRKYSFREFSLEERVLTQGRLLWQYLGWILLPNITSMGFFHDDIPLSRGLLSPLTTGLSLLAWIAVLGIAWQLRGRFPLLLFALLFYLVGHSLESTVYPLEMVFEHRNYLPSMGVCLLAAVALYNLARSSRHLGFRVFIFLALSVLSVQLFLRTQAWQDQMTLARINVINHPDSPRANFFYGQTLLARHNQADELGLDEEETKALAISSRAHFMRMHNLAPDDFPAITFLYQLDKLHFPTLSEEYDWLGRIEAAAQAKRIHASDRGALAALIAFSGTPAGASDLSRLRAILDRLVERYPGNLDLVSLQYRVKAAQPGVDREALRANLMDAALSRPGNRLLNAYLVQHYGPENMALAYDALRNWMLQDTRRRELSVIRRMFER